MPAPPCARRYWSLISGNAFAEGEEGSHTPVAEQQTKEGRNSTSGEPHPEKYRPKASLVGLEENGLEAIPRPACRFASRLPNSGSSSFRNAPGFGPYQTSIFSRQLRVQAAPSAVV